MSSPTKPPPPQHNYWLRSKPQLKSYTTSKPIVQQQQQPVQHIHFHVHVTIMASSLADRIRTVQKQQIELLEFTQQLASFDKTKLEEHLLEKAKRWPRHYYFEVEYNAVPGFKPCLSPDNSQVAALYWKEWEKTNGIRVTAITDGQSLPGLTFTWLSHDGSNQNSWVEPKGVEELLSSSNSNKRTRTD